MSGFATTAGILARRRCAMGLIRIVRGGHSLRRLLVALGSLLHSNLASELLLVGPDQFDALSKAPDTTVGSYQNRAMKES
jgi:hypothetical protein